MLADNICRCGNVPLVTTACLLLAHFVSVAVVVCGRYPMCHHRSSSVSRTYQNSKFLHFSTKSVIGGSHVTSQTVPFSFHHPTTSIQRNRVRCAQIIEQYEFSAGIYCARALNTRNTLCTQSVLLFQFNLFLFLFFLSRDLFCIVLTECVAAQELDFHRKLSSLRMDIVSVCFPPFLIKLKIWGDSGSQPHAIQQPFKQKMRSQWRRVRRTHRVLIKIWNEMEKSLHVPGIIRT